MLAVDRHLLLGLVALQNGLIDRDGLLAAFQSWIRDKARPLADHLVALGYLDAERRTIAEAIAALHLDAHGGDAGKSLAALPDATCTRATLVALGDPEVERTLVQAGHAGESEELGRVDGLAASRGPRFRILRPHARGALGAVFVAEDRELHREVALKQILDQHADDPGSRARFVLEAEITGGLEHPGIVPVYGLGADGQGRPYYAMRFVRGDSLREAIDRFHADPARGRTTAAGRWACAGCCGGSSTSATRSTSPIRAA